VPGNPSPEAVLAATWLRLLDDVPLQPDTVHRLAVEPARRVTHVRLRIDPDGGVARLRVHAQLVPDPRELDGLSLDVAAASVGGVVVACSDMHFGDRRNLVAPRGGADHG